MLDSHSYETGVSSWWSEIGEFSSSQVVCLSWLVSSSCPEHFVTLTALGHFEKSACNGHQWFPLLGVHKLIIWPFLLVHNRLQRWFRTCHDWLSRDTRTDGPIWTWLLDARSDQESRNNNEKEHFWIDSGEIKSWKNVDGEHCGTQSA